MNPGSIMKKTFFLFAVIFITFIQAMTTSAEPFVSKAPSYILVDAKTGTVLCQKNADNKMYPASTTKMLTAILAIEKGDMNKIATASKEAIHDIGTDGMNIGIAPGEQMRLEDLLNAMLIKSANETANIVAESLAPTRQDFVNMMNVKAKELGATHSNFMNPCGMHDDNHYTTPRDLAVIARHALTLPKFREIVVKKAYTMPPTNMHKKWDTLYTTNRLLYYTSPYFTQVTGVKSGYTGQAGHNLVSAAKNAQGTELIAVIMGEGGNAKYQIALDSKLLLEHGFRDYALQKVNQQVNSILVGNAKKKFRLDLVPASEFSSILPKDKNEWHMTTKQNIPPHIKLPIKKGDIVGNLEYYREGSLIGKVNLVAASSINKEASKKTKKGSIFFTIIKVLLGVVIFFFALRLTLRTISRRLKVKRKRKAYHIDIK